MYTAHESINCEHDKEVIEFAEARSEDIVLKDEKSTYTRLMSNVKCSKIKVEAIE